MTRSEHLQWCKDRDIEYLDKEDQDNSFASMISDLGKHPELEHHIGIELGMMLKVAGGLSTNQEMRNWVLGFN